MNGTETEMLMDVRPMPSRERHSTLFSTWNALANGQAIRLVNDHDPLPLYYQFACERGGTFRWEYLERGPETWQVRITKGQFAEPGFTPRVPMAVPEPPRTLDDGPITLDVRPIFARGETPCAAIDAAVARVGAGQTLILLAPFEPVPLYAKLGRQGLHGASKLLEDGSWRIEFRRTGQGEAMSVACTCGHA